MASLPTLADVLNGGPFQLPFMWGSENGSNVSPRRPDPNLEIPMKALSALLLTALFAGTAVAAPPAPCPRTSG
jgi:hypothetical protein